MAAVTDETRGAGRLEHIVVDRLVPVLLIVIIPILGVIYVADARQHEARRDQLRASCERGNDIRRDQRVILDLLTQASAVLSIGSSDPDVRAYFQQSVATLRERREKISIVDCHKEIS